MDSRSLKAMNLSLSCEALENRHAEPKKFLAAPVPVPGVKYPGGFRQNVPTPVPLITNVTALMRINHSVHFMFTYVVKFRPLLESDTPYL